MPAVIIRIPHIFFTMTVPFDDSFHFKYFWIYSVNEPARIITRQWPAPYAASKKKLWRKLDDEENNVIWLVKTDDLVFSDDNDPMNDSMNLWNPTEYLFEYDLISFEDINGVPVP